MARGWGGGGVDVATVHSNYTVYVRTCKSVCS